MKPLLALLVMVTSIAAQNPVPVDENWLTGSLEAGYRWRSDVAGSFDTYRSIVNLGSGLKLLSADFTVIDPSKRFFDRLNVRALNLGDDPYETVHLDAAKQKLYRLSVDYRNIAYFSAMPSYALGEQTFDTHRRTGSFDLDLLPGRWWTPYLAFSRSSSSGTGATAFVSDANEYAVPSRLDDVSSQFRGGVRMDVRHIHATLEQGFTTYRDDQNLFSGPQTNPGNRTVPLLGKTLSLGTLVQDDGVRGNGLFSKASVSANVTSWLDLSGQFLYSQAQNDVHLSNYSTGNFVILNQLLFYTGQQYLLAAQSKLPHTSAAFGAEIRTLHRLRIVESLLTDRLHDTGSSSPYSAKLSSNYSQQQADAFYDLTTRITLRAGYRYEWGDGNQFLIPADSLASRDSTSFQRNAGLGGVSFRAGTKLSAYLDGEAGASNDAYFRTSLHNFQKLRARARYQLTPSLNLAADFSFLNNDNPAAGVHLVSQTRQESVSLLWAPKGGERWSVQTSYDRSAVRSDITYLVPQDLTTALSSYRDNAHSITALVDAKLPRKGKLSFGGTAYVSSGSRPSTFYQPQARISVPAGNNLTWFGEWAWYGFGESFYQYEAFHVHLLTAGLRYTR